VSIHRKGELPTFEHAAFASAGQFTKFEVRKSLHQRISDAWDPCLEPQHASQEDYAEIRDLSGMKHTYSQMGCMMISFQDAVFGNCSCINSDYFVLPSSVNITLQELHFCGAATEDLELLDLETACVLNSTSHAIPGVLQLCVVPCDEAEHSLTVTSSDWPTEATQLAFYNDFIKGKSFSSHFSTYEKINQEFLKTQDRRKTMEELEKISLIRENFAKIEIVVPSLRGNLYSMSYQMSVSSLTASIGGNLNLWSGISAILIIEVLDLIIKILLSASINPSIATKKVAVMPRQ